LDDFNGLRRHSRVVATAKPLALPGLRPRWTSLPRLWRRSSLFKGLGAETCHESESHSKTLTGRASRIETASRAGQDFWKTVLGFRRLGKKLSIFLDRPSPPTIGRFRRFR
jgi:hypothetical protein